MKPLVRLMFGLVAFSCLVPGCAAPLARHKEADLQIDRARSNTTKQKDELDNMRETNRLIDEALRELRSLRLILEGNR